LQEIFRKNMEFERQSPYNFCDQWCERCVYEKQIRCKVYLDELEQKMVCIAHDREPGDPEITEAVLRKQLEDAGEKLEQFAEENEIDLDNIDDPEFEKIREHIKFVENNPLLATVEQYRKKGQSFLKNTFYNQQEIKGGLTDDFETVAWYHTLLPVKLQRALAGFHEPAAEGDISIYDAVAQFEICKKAINRSVSALQNIAKKDKSLHNRIMQLLAILRNIFSRIDLMESEI